MVRGSSEGLAALTHTLWIPEWHPARLNEIHGHWAARGRRKKADAQMVWAYARQSGIPIAETKRRVTLTILLQPRQRAGDPDSYWKALLDSMVKCGLLKNDSHRWVELAPVLFDRPLQGWGTRIELEDLHDPPKKAAAKKHETDSASDVARGEAPGREGGEHH